jgi:hypothetical protein
MSTTALQIVYIKHRDSESVTVDCPFCQLEHTHRTSGVNTACCGLGCYSAISDYPGPKGAES